MSPPWFLRCRGTDRFRVSAFTRVLSHIPSVWCCTSTEHHQIYCMTYPCPQVLEAAWHALEDAGMDPTALAGKRVGVYIGASTKVGTDRGTPRCARR